MRNIEIHKHFLFKKLINTVFSFIKTVTHKTYIQDFLPRLKQRRLRQSTRQQAVSQARPGNLTPPPATQEDAVCTTLYYHYVKYRRN